MSSELKKIDSLELRSQAIQMRREGFSLEHISTALGFPEDQIKLLLNENYVLGSAEQILQECIRVCVSSIPLADAKYKEQSSSYNQQALTGFISTTKDLVKELENLKSASNAKEDMYRVITQKVLETFCRTMIKSMMESVKLLNTTLKSPDANSEKEIKKFSENLGIKFSENYTKAKNDLGEVLGLSSDVKARTNLSINDDLDL